MKKKIIFILCTIIILCVGSIVNAATSLKDVKNTKYEEPVNMLTTLGLVNGYPEDNTYRPDNVVTRAEMAKLMVVALGEESNVAAAAKESQKFKDVKSSDWEYGYVNLASKLGIIKGYPDGTFGSKSTVSYAEATTMMIRALEYEDEVNKSNEVWPNNYINQAKKLSLYTSVGTINSNDGAKRGNIAILLWNMLRIGVCSPIGQTGDQVIYGEGEFMLNKNMTKFTYLEDALVSSVEFDDTYEEAIVKITSGNKTLKITIDALEAAEMYGQKFNILYNSSSKVLELAEKSTDNKTKEGEITKLTSTKIYIDGGSSSGYKLPDDKNILLYGIDDLDEAVTATLVLDGSTVKYVIGYAPEKVYLGLVTNTEVTVSNKDGLKVVNFKESSAKSYALQKDETMPDIDDIILYYLNSDNELVIIEKTNVFASKEVDTATSTKIVTGKTTYKLSDTLYKIAKVSSTSLKSMTVTSIEEDVDSVSVIYFGGERYFVVFIGGVDEALEKLETDIKAESKTLKNYIEKNAVTTAYNNEVKYTLATYTRFRNAFDDSKTAISNAAATISVANLNKLKSAYTEVQAAYNALKLISSLSTTTEKNEETSLVNAKIALRKIVNGTTEVSGKKVTTCITNKDTYTTASYTTFNTALTNANNVLKSTTATLNRIEIATENLKNGVKGLVTKTEDSARTEAMQKLNAAITSGDAKKSNASSYTEASYNNLLSRLEEAKNIKNNSASTVAQITTATTNLINAMALLTNNLEEVLDDLNRLLLDAQEELEKEDIYMPETYSELKKYYDAAQLVKANDNATKAQIEECYNKLETAYENLYKIDDKVKDVKDKAATYNLQSIKTAGEALSYEATSGDKIAKMEELEEAMEQEDMDMARYKGFLQTEISVAELIAGSIDTEEAWTAQNYKGTLQGMKDALKAAKDLLGDSGKEEISSATLKAAWETLQSKLAKNA